MKRPLTLLAVAALALCGCPKKEEKAAASASVACYSADQHRCVEAPAAGKAQDEAIGVECGSGSGKLTRPAACPPEGFLGKCTTTENGVVTVRRWYTGADAAYQKSFCAEPARGVWSTTF